MEEEAGEEETGEEETGEEETGEETGKEAQEETRGEAGLFRLFAPVFAVVRSIPPGKVMTYGQVADATSGVSLTARQVGAALRWIPPDVPWQRVVGAGGHLPIVKRGPDAQQRQRELLVGEGAVFLARDPNRVDMARSQWFPDTISEDLAAPVPAEASDEQGSLFTDDDAVLSAS